MRIWAANYILRFKKSAAERPGALLRIEYAHGEVGHADLHPWPEFQDLPLAQQLSALRTGSWTPLLKRSVALAKLDATFRARQQSAFEGNQIPRSHFLLPELCDLDQTKIDDIWQSGFRTLKIKVGRDPQMELSQLQRLSSRLQKFCLRLDFNARLSSWQLLNFLEGMPTILGQQIDFLEDPVPWDQNTWQELVDKYGLSLALDHIGTLEESAAWWPPWLIVKPAVQDPALMHARARLGGARLCVTSYLDHPVGQMGAALEASRLPWQEPVDCGLLSHLVYDQSEFSEAMRVTGAQLYSAEGTGIGFDDLLAKQKWYPLVD